MYQLKGIILCAVMLFLGASCQRAPWRGYADSPAIVQKREELTRKLLQFVPREQRKAATPEARWLADTAYKGAAAIARYNRPVFVNWLNNRAVNTRFHIRHRGLCWHYQHDMYRELRRRPLKYFRLGCCARDIGNGSEHHVVYLTNRHGAWPRVILLDAWWSNGRLRTHEKFDEAKWMDDPYTAERLGKLYPAGHQLPLEYWAVIRRGIRYKDYVYSHTPEARSSRQWHYMQKQIQRGKERRKGKAIDY